MTNHGIQLASAAPLTPVSAAPLTLSGEQESLLRDMYGNGASDTEFQVFLEVCRARRLNPLTRQIYFVQRWDSEKQRNVWSAQVSIDGFRAIAERTGKYDGQDEPEFEYDDKRKLVLARVKVYRKDWTRAAVGVARFDEYSAKKRDGTLTHMWATKGHVMISKCAEALALRKAFPEELSGVYAPEEMDGAEDVRPRRGQSVTETVAASEPLSEEMASPFPRLKEQLEKLEELIAKCTRYEEALTIRAELGSKARPRDALLTREMQEAIGKGEGPRTITPPEASELGRRWQRCDRQLAKKEKEFAPGVEQLMGEMGDAYEDDHSDVPTGDSP